MKQAGLRCWYISIARMLEFVRAQGSDSQALHALQNFNEQWSRIFLANIFGKSLLEEIERRMVPPLQSLAAEGRIRRGQDFIFNSTYQGKGFGASNRGQSVSLSSNVSKFSDHKRLLIEFSKSGLITDTAYSRLNERANLFVYGSVTEVDGETVKAVPYVVADLIERDDEVGLDLPIYNNPYTPPSVIDQFSGVDFSAAVDEPTFRKLKDIPENSVKEFLAKLLGEFDPPKDWGGEQCDLYTGNISIAGLVRTVSRRRLARACWSSEVGGATMVLPPRKAHGYYLPEAPGRREGTRSSRSEASWYDATRIYG